MPVELFETRVADDDACPRRLAFGTIVDLRAERFRELLLQAREIRIGCAAPRARCACPDARTDGRAAPFRAPIAPARRTRAAAAVCWPAASASSARACPMSICPCIRYACTGFASSRRRSRLVTALRERRPPLPPHRASVPNSSISRWSPLRLLERIQILALDVLDQRQRKRRVDRAPPCTSAGTSASPARFAARQRRSPATISKRPPSIGRTRIGCITPCSRIDAASSSSAASSICVRG